MNAVCLLFWGSPASRPALAGRPGITPGIGSMNPKNPPGKPGSVRKAAHPSARGNMLRQVRPNTVGAVDLKWQLEIETALAS